MTESIYRKILAFWEHFSLEGYVCLIFFLASLILLTGFSQSIKIIVVFFVIVGCFLWLKLKNLFLSYSLVAFFGLPFFLPGKYYTVLALPGFYIKEIAFKEGVFLDYGLGAKDVFIILAFLLLVREILLMKRPKESILRVLNTFWLTLFSAILFFSLVSCINSLYSPFFFLSEVWLVQYSFYYLMAAVVYFLYILYPSRFQLLIYTFLCSGVFQFVVAIWQFFIQGFIGLPLEVSTGTIFGTGLDENNSLFRVHGTTVYHNQLALIALLVFIITFPYFLRKKNVSMTLVASLNLITIVLTQSRSIWFALGVVLFFLHRQYKANGAYFLDKIGRSRFVFYSLGLTFLLSFIFLPRLLLINNFFYKGGGGYVRFLLIKEGLQSLSYSLPFGYGVGTNHVVLHSFFPDGVTTIFPATVHVALIQLALETGLVGTILFIFPIFILLRRISIDKNKRYTSRVFLYGIFAFFIFYLFLPHNGTIEFSYLGVILGFGHIAKYQEKNGVKDESI